MSQMPSDNFKNFCVQISNKLSLKALKSFRKYLHSNKCDEIPGIASIFLDDFRQIIYQVFSYNLPEGLLDDKAPFDPIYRRSSSLPDNFIDERISLVNSVLSRDKQILKEHSYDEDLSQDRSDIMENSLTLPAYANASTVLAVARSKKITKQGRLLPSHKKSINRSSVPPTLKEKSSIKTPDNLVFKKRIGLFSIRNSLDAFRRKKILKPSQELETREIGNSDQEVFDAFMNSSIQSNHTALPPPPFLEAECIKYGLLHTWIGHNQFFQLFSSGLNSLKRRLETVESLNLQWIRCKLVLYRCSAGYIIQVFIPPKDSKPSYGLFCGHITKISPVDPSHLNNEPRDNVFLIKTISGEIKMFRAETQSECLAWQSAIRQSLPPLCNLEQDFSFENTLKFFKSCSVDPDQMNKLSKPKCFQNPLNNSFSQGDRDTIRSELTSTKIHGIYPSSSTVATNSDGQQSMLEILRLLRGTSVEQDFSTCPNLTSRFSSYPLRHNPDFAGRCCCYSNQNAIKSLIDIPVTEILPAQTTLPTVKEIPQINHNHENGEIMNLLTVDPTDHGQRNQSFLSSNGTTTSQGLNFDTVSGEEIRTNDCISNFDNRPLESYAWFHGTLPRSKATAYVLGVQIDPQTNVQTPLIHFGSLFRGFHQPVLGENVNGSQEMFPGSAFHQPNNKSYDHNPSSQLAAMNGVFIVRKSETISGEYVLTFSCQRRVKHLRMTVENPEQGGRCHLQHLSFSSIVEMLEHFRHETIPLEEQSNCSLSPGNERNDLFNNQLKQSTNLNAFVVSLASESLLVVYRGSLRATDADVCRMIGSVITINGNDTSSGSMSPEEALKNALKEEEENKKLKDIPGKFIVL